MEYSRATKQCLTMNASSISNAIFIRPLSQILMLSFKLEKFFPEGLDLVFTWIIILKVLILVRRLVEGSGHPNKFCHVD